MQPNGLRPARFLYPWDFPGKNTGVGSHFLLQEIFQTQGSNLGLLTAGRFFTTELLGNDLEIPYEYTVEVRNRFKGLDLIDRVPEELWMEVRDIVQEVVIKVIPKKKKCKKAKWLSDEALQIAEKRREGKGKGKKGKIYPFECKVPKNSK